MPDEQDATCGHSAIPSDLPEGVTPRECPREVWKSGSCVWHAEEINKPVRELSNSIDVDDRRIDDAFLKQAELHNRIDFVDFDLYNPDFQDADLDSADFRAANIYGGNFSGASLEGAKFDSEEIFEEADSTRLTNTCFCSSEIKGANFSDSILSETCFDEATGSSAQFNGADVSGDSFKHANVPDIEFEAANLRKADFEGANIFNGNFNRAFLKGADFSNADLRQSKFNWARMEDVDLRGSIVDKDTEFDTMSVYELTADRFHEGRKETNFDIFKLPPSEITVEQSLSIDPALYTVKEYISTINRKDKIRNSVSRFKSRLSSNNCDKTRGHLSTAVNWYRDLQRVYDDSLVTEKKRWYAIREKEAERKIQYGNKSKSWLRLSFHRVTMRHGESPERVLAVSGMTVIFFALLYGFVGVQDMDTGQLLQYRLSGEWTWKILAPVQLSISRFLTPSNVYYKPLDSITGLALIESVIGALLIAMFVFTLGRRATE